MRKITLILLGLVLLITCAEQPQPTAESITIDLRQEEDRWTTINNLFEEISYIPLETSPRCLLSDIKKVEEFNGEFYVMGEHTYRAVMVFDAEGKFLREIGRQGNGRGEFTHIEDFTLDREGGRVILLSEGSQINVYELGGTFLEKRTLSESYLRNIGSNSRGFLCTTNHQTYTEGEHAFLYYYFDKAFNLLKKHTAVLPTYRVYPQPLAFQLKVSNNQFYYLEKCTHTLYQLDDSATITALFPYLLENPMPQDFFESSSQVYENLMEYGNLFDHLCIGDYRYTFFIQNERPRVAISDKEGKVLLNRGFGGHLPILDAGEGGTILRSVAASEFVAPIREAKWDGKELGIDPNDNYILIRCTLKAVSQ